MEWIKKNWSLLLVAAFAGLWVYQCNRKAEPVEIIREVKIEIPIIEKVFDTIIPDPKTVVIKEIDSTVYKEYLKLKDSVQKDSAYKEAIRIREYNQIFKDTFQTVNVFSKVRGELLKQSISYKTEPRTITVKDTIKIKPKNSFSLGAEVGLPTIPELNNTPVIKGGLIFTNKKGNSLSLSYDTEGKFWIGKTFKIF